MNGLDLGEAECYLLEPLTTDDTIESSTSPSLQNFISHNIESAEEHFLPDEARPTARNRLRQVYKRLSGWRRGVIYCALSALGVLLINLVLLVWASARYGVEDGFGLLHAGSCDRARTISTTLHLLINILSTVLLGASNYTMQCLNSPTRGDIDRAHAERKWLDIGIPSWKNRKYMGKKNLALWWLLGMSSVPLHFLLVIGLLQPCIQADAGRYNSSVFLDIAAQNYKVFMTTDTLPQLMESGMVRNESELVQLSWKDCQRIYCRPFVYGNGDMYLVVNKDSLNQPNVSTTHYMDVDIGNQWPTENLASYFQGYIGGQAGESITLDLGVKSCYSKVEPETCKVRFSRSIILVVILCNACKAVCMFMVSWKSEGSPLVTLGVAIASFLDDPDQTTKGLCLASKEDIQNKIWLEDRRPRLWIGRAERFFQAANTNRWVMINFM